MKLVMTILVRDEADIIDAQLAFHLNAGVDFVLATDNGSVDGTVDILEAYARDGYLHLLREPGGDYRQLEWVTRMARLAATDFGADWVINSDADEFWWPRGGSLRDVLAAVPERFGIVPAFNRDFLPRPFDGGFFAERMTARLSPHAPVNDPAGPYRPRPKVVHRADRHVFVARGAHALVNSAFEPLRTWHPIEALHFPIRSPEQSDHKAMLQWQGFVGTARGYGTGYHAKAYQARSEGWSGEYYRSLSVDDETLARGVADGILTIDTRLRDALRALRLTPSETPDDLEGGSPAGHLRRFALPGSADARLDFTARSVADEAGVAADAAVLSEAASVRRLRQLDALEARLGPSSAPGLATMLRGLARRRRVVG